MKAYRFQLVLLVVLMLAACGPGPEEQTATAAALTAAAATDTPRPTATPTDTPVPTATATNTATPTPTPVPFDLTVSVVDEAGAPIEGAALSFTELASTVFTDASGAAAWTDLPGDTASFIALAQGYLPGEAATVLERGPNELVLTLARDPYGILPGEACAAGETLLYLEDFQDGAAPGWPEIEFAAQGWGIAPDADSPENLLVAFTGSDHTGSQYQSVSVADGVWRMRVRVTGMRGFSFNWLHGLEPYELEGQEVFDARYQIVFSTEGPGGTRRLEQPVYNIPVANGTLKLQPGRWYFFEISTFEGHTEVWVDGVMVMAYTDPKPIGPGTIGLEVFPPTDPGEGVFFDDLAVCGLSAPFSTLVPPAP